MDTDRLLDIFDFDLEIDFETAYEMINKEDQNAKHATERSLVENEVDRWSMTDTPLVKREDDTLKGHFDGDHKDFEVEHLRHRTEAHRAGLLSEFESTAIEHFLDSLVASDGKNLKDSFSPTWDELPRGVHQDPCEKRPVHNQEPLSKLESSLNFHVGSGQQGSKERTSIASASYAPAIIKSPDITVSDSEVPANLQNDPIKRKQWKHVVLEKKRRNAIKVNFDDLIKLIRFPRASVMASQEAQLKECSLNEDVPRKKLKPDRAPNKRIPKHVLLNYIIEDMELLSHANKSLEDMLEG
ncbi:LAQU0S25e00584g1_1 [Lachancea quebecensis]|uniref:LAQU0S25e00584g1_1 n=1 Tax=Lachancea quebecensis TaxID=1654605 RepID=A0A0P1KZW4_9SACH|nr:LAQU0S25e00584g1_1 [Lachancea quebecensis]